MSEVEPRPIGVTICGLDELGGRAGDVTHILSILDPGTAEPEALRGFDLGRRLKLHFHDVIDPTPGWVAPEMWDVELLLAFGRDLDAFEPAAGAGEPHPHLLVHCHAGLSRSTAAAILILAQREPTQPVRDIVGRIIRLRPRAWPNLRIIEFGDRLLGRDGEIVAAVHALYQLALSRDPWLAEAMIESGREREVRAAGMLP
ncbi:MAG TPA: protein-tyrosine-phosphatase [Stellaceae bacterium]|nr:protein-tyrosine-phosphatase [Stellaceae bacterium]